MFINIIKKGGNFMNTKLKVLVASVISSIMLLSGCSGSKDTTTDNTSIDKPGDIADYSDEPLTIDVAVNDHGAFDPVKDPIAKLIQEKFPASYD
jgi:PBP1b-binding outer membrane lipoprotein LpoB